MIVTQIGNQYITVRKCSTTPDGKSSNYSKRPYWWSWEIHIEKKKKEIEKNAHYIIPFVAYCHCKETNTYLLPLQASSIQTFCYSEPIHYLQNVHIDKSKHKQINASICIITEDRNQVVIFAIFYRKVCNWIANYKIF